MIINDRPARLDGRGRRVLRAASPFSAIFDRFSPRRFDRKSFCFKGLREPPFSGRQKTVKTVENGGKPTGCALMREIAGRKWMLARTIAAVLALGIALPA